MGSLPLAHYGVLMGKREGEKEKGRRPPGPPADRLKIEEKDWEEAVKKALRKPPPPKQKAPKE